MVYYKINLPAPIHHYTIYTHLLLFFWLLDKAIKIICIYIIHRPDRLVSNCQNKLPKILYGLKNFIEFFSFYFIVLWMFYIS